MRFFQIFSKFIEISDDILKEIEASFDHIGKKLQQLLFKEPYTRVIIFIKIFCQLNF